ncbi:MAG: murein L,D-transpeptidase catalytic domain family protein [Bacteroidia bacterium]|nr:murein L,D-transpeptidase catalytic domain family protein [Bacteroidia bacterium]
MSPFAFTTDSGPVMTFNDAPLTETSSEAGMVCIDNINDFQNYCDSLYSRLNDGSVMPSEKVFKVAMKGYASLLNKGALQNTGVITIIDYSLSSNIKRLWVIDIMNSKVLFHELVAHGKKSGEEFAKSFSNKVSSYKTSIGFFITGEIYSGKHNNSLKLIGLEKNYNGNAFDRGIVIHGADYVSPDFIAGNQRLGRSEGCPAVSQDIVESLIKTIQNGSCVFSYFPNSQYLTQSRILKTGLPYRLPASA